MTIGEKLKCFRKSAGYTQEELSKILSVTPQAISKWETDKGTPDINLLVPISSALGITVDALLKSDIEDSDMLSEELSSIYGDRSRTPREKYTLYKNMLENDPNRPEIMRMLLLSSCELLESGSDISDRERQDVLEECEKCHSFLYDHEERRDIYLANRMFRIYAATENYGKAAEAIAELPKRIITQALSYGKMYFERGEHRSAISHFRESFDEGIRVLFWSMHRTAESFERLGEREKSYEIFNIESQMLEALFGNCVAPFPLVPEYSYTVARLAEAAAFQGDAEKTFEFLDKLINCAEHCRNESVDSLSKCILLSAHDCQKTSRYPSEKYIRYWLDRACFDFIRDEQRFRDYYRVVF